jgi:alpha,alpha-trehalase
MSTSYIDAACTIYCEGPVLQAVQLSRIFNDSKTFVDMPMRYDPDQTLAAFNNLADPNNVQELKGYLSEYFLPAGSDLNTWVPTDFTNDPQFLDYITDMDYKSWASDLNQLWLILGREVNATVKENPQRHSYVPRNYPMIVPGGRFRESYYWDSWWIVRGLLVCDMESTALYVINNLLGDVDTFGFVPNGGRIYYLDRSQPPLLSEMVRSYYRYMIDKYRNTDVVSSFLSSAYETLKKEYSFWMDAAHGHVVEMPPGDGDTVVYRLNRYYSNYTTPRPESYLADYDNAHASGRDLSDYYQQVRAGAETGWDFSSRWISPDGNVNSTTAGYNITNINTNQVVPVDLNSILYRFELNMAQAARELGDEMQYYNYTLTLMYYAEADSYIDAAELRSTAINRYLWDSAAKHWRDYNLTSQGFTHTSASDNAFARPSATPSAEESDNSGPGAAADNSYSTVAYWVPLWAGILPTDNTTADQLVSSLQASGILQAGGVLTTTINTGQQWDAPDAWPPEVLFTIEGLQQLGTTASRNLAVRYWESQCNCAFYSP